VPATLRSIALAARPKTLPAAIVPVWAGCVLAWHLERAFAPGLAAATLLGAVCIQIATNFFNDAIDSRKGADTSRRLGPLRVTASGLLSPAAVHGVALVFLGLAFGCGVVLYQSRGWPIILIGVPSLALSYGYTGGPFPLAYRGMGELFVVLFFGWVAVCGTVFIQTGSWPPAGWLLGAQVGLLSATLISINNLRDRAEDATTGKRTLAVRWGHHGGTAVIGAELALATLAGLCWLPLGNGPLLLASLPVVVLGSIILRGITRQPPGPAYNRVLALAGLQLLAFAAIFHLIAAWNG
jgi:1,4-dihydroxy-2-naphthoate octaprenyltransferase